jgi:hypothetical protein
MEVSLGQYALPVILAVAMGVVYQTVGDKIQDRWKSLIACGIGTLLGIVSLLYKEGPWDAKNIIDAVLYGFMSGASAVGIYEVQRSARRPRS